MIQRSQHGGGCAPLSDPAGDSQGKQILGGNLGVRHAGNGPSFNLPEHYGKSQTFVSDYSSFSFGLRVEAPHLETAPKVWSSKSPSDP